MEISSRLKPKWLWTKKSFHPEQAVRKAIVSNLYQEKFLAFHRVYERLPLNS